MNIVALVVPEAQAVLVALVALAVPADPAVVALKADLVVEVQAAMKEDVRNALDAPSRQLTTISKG
jgi:hypothetical protein